MINLKNGHNANIHRYVKDDNNTIDNTILTSANNIVDI